MDTIAFPENLNALYVLLNNPLAWGILLSLFIQSIPAIQNPAVADWKKVLIVILFCTGWSLFITAIGPNGLPKNSAEWYSLVRLDLGVLFSNQVFYELWMGLPFVGGFVLRLFSRQMIDPVKISVKLPPMIEEPGRIG